jgi:hypothetical protein
MESKTEDNTCGFIFNLKDGSCIHLLGALIHLGKSFPGYIAPTPTLVNRRIKRSNHHINRLLSQEVDGVAEMVNLAPFINGSWSKFTPTTIDKFSHVLQAPQLLKIFEGLDKRVMNSLGQEGDKHPREFITLLSNP